MPAICFACEPFGAAWPEIEAMHQAHFDEVAFTGEDRPKIDVQVFGEASSIGRLKTFTLRDGAALVGYALFWLNYIPQHAGQRGAWQEAVYLAPSHRLGSAGRNFLHLIDLALAGMGVDRVFHSVRPGRDFGPVLKRMGYQPIETIYSKKVR